MTARVPDFDNYGRPGVLFVEKLKTLASGDLIEEATKRIWLSAYANNNPKSDYHWQAAACYDEAERCGRPDLYARAFARATDQDVIDTLPPVAIRDLKTGHVLPIGCAAKRFGLVSRNGGSNGRTLFAGKRAVLADGGGGAGGVWELRLAPKATPRTAATRVFGAVFVRARLFLARAGSHAR